MKHYESIQQPMKDYKNLSYPGRVYIEGDKKNNYRKSQFWVLSSKEAKDQDWIENVYGFIPKSLSKLNAYSFLDVGTFQDIINNTMERNPSLSINDIDIFIEAINYYLENDDFQD